MPSRPERIRIPRNVLVNKPHTGYGEETASLFTKNLGGPMKGEWCRSTKQKKKNKKINKVKQNLGRPHR